MAIKAMEYVWGNMTEYNGGELLLLLALADNCSIEGTCFPSIGTLAQRSRLSKRYVIKLLNKFSKLGIIGREKRKRNNGSYQSSLYYFNPYRISVDLDALYDDSFFASDEPSSDPEDTTLVIQRTPLEPLIEPLNNQELFPLPVVEEAKKQHLHIEPDGTNSTYAIEARYKCAIGEDWLAILHSKKVSPKGEKAVNPNPMYDAIAAVFKAHGGLNGLIRILLTGEKTSNSKQAQLWYACRLEDPATAEEVGQWGKWYQATFPNMSPLRTPEKVQSDFIRFREETKAKPQQTQAKSQTVPIFKGLPVTVLKQLYPDLYQEYLSQQGELNHAI